jgi:hypothetical protein
VGRGPEQNGERRLAAVGIVVRAGHGEGAAPVFERRAEFGLELLDRAPLQWRKRRQAVFGRAQLDHKTGFHPVEVGPIENAGAGQAQQLLDVSRGRLRVERQDDVARDGAEHDPLLGQAWTGHGGLTGGDGGCED